MPKTYFWISKETCTQSAACSAAAHDSACSAAAHDSACSAAQACVYSAMLPPEFIACRNPKWIVIEECKATFKSALVGDVIMHADFIQRDHYLDYACCFVNEDRRDLAKYEIGLVQSQLSRFGSQIFMEK